MKITWDMKDEDIQIAFMYLDDEKKHEALTLYWGEKWGAGAGFSISGRVSSTYYSHEPIEADSVAEAKEKAEIWFSEKIKECLDRCTKSVEYYKTLLSVLPDPMQNPK